MDWIQTYGHSEYRTFCSSCYMKEKKCKKSAERQLFKSFWAEIVSKYVKLALSSIRTVIGFIFSYLGLFLYIFSEGAINAELTL